MFLVSKKMKFTASLFEETRSVHWLFLVLKKKAELTVSGFKDETVLYWVFFPK